MTNEMVLWVELTVLLVCISLNSLEIKVSEFYMFLVDESFDT